MTTKTVLITGISGQDGSNLSEHLLSLGYEVWGIVRRQSVCAHQNSRLLHLGGLITTRYGDMTDPASLRRVIAECEPDEIYNLAGQSHVGISSQIPRYTADVNAVGVLNLLEAVREISPGSRTYQASSSELFGQSVDKDGMQRETTPMHPVSPYGCAKLYAYHICRHYREAYDMHISNGILFNHSSERRGENFVEQKIIQAAVRIKAGFQKKLELGNISSVRDWGASRDYVRAMHLMLQQETPDDYVIASGTPRSIEDMCRLVFHRLGMNWKDYVTTNDRYRRPQELDYLCGDSSKAREVLKWKPQISFDDLINGMIHHAQIYLLQGGTK